MTERKPSNVSWEDFCEQKLREAFDAGLFGKLSGQGQPIPSLDEPLNDNWWIRRKLREEQVSLLPPLLEARRDIDQTRARILGVSSERRVLAELTALRDRVRCCLDSPAPSPAVIVLPVDVDAELDRWRSARRRPASCRGLTE